jgi:LuxR family maltose regulon positive regulatory protein
VYSHFETIPVFVVPHTLQTVSHALCIAITTTFAYFCAASNWVATMAYGVLVRAAIETKDKDCEETAGLARRYLKLCSDNGLHEYFRLRRAYGPVLEFAYDNGIEADFARQMMEFAGYRPKKAHVESLGAFTVYRDKARRSIVKFRTKKERELLAFLLDAGDKGATKEQMHNAIWWESESGNIKNLIAVNLSHLKNDLEGAGLREPVICRENRYFISREEIEWDIDLFEKTYEEFRHHSTKELARKLLTLYKGEYLSDLEALWAAAKRIRYREMYEEAQAYLSMKQPAKRTASLPLGGRS